MLYSFTGGPLDEKMIEVHESDMKEGKYVFLEWGEYEDTFALLPPLTIHYYLPVGDTMLWVVPDELIK